MVGRYALTQCIDNTMPILVFEWHSSWDYKLAERTWMGIILCQILLPTTQVIKDSHIPYAYPFSVHLPCNFSIHSPERSWATYKYAHYKNTNAH